MKFCDGEVYDGEWRDGLKHGIGIYLFKNGDVYEGGFIEGKKDGEGRYKMANGKLICGMWKDDKLIRDD